MNNYCLTINVRSQNEALLNNLVVTLETLNEDFTEIDGVEMFTATSVEENLSVPVKEDSLDKINKAVYLECWMIDEETPESL